MRTFCFDNISKDKQQFKYKPTVIYDILFLQSEKALSQSKPKGEDSHISIRFSPMPTDLQTG